MAFFIRRHILETNGQLIHCNIVEININGVNWYHVQPYANFLQYSLRLNGTHAYVTKKNRLSYKEIKQITGESAYHLCFTIQDRSTFVNQSGIFELIIRSKTNTGTEYRRFITQILLPNFIDYNQRNHLNIHELFEITITSKFLKAIQFQDWLTSDILPFLEVNHTHTPVFARCILNLISVLISRVNNNRSNLTTAKTHLINYLSNRSTLSEIIQTRCKN